MLTGVPIIETIFVAPSIGAVPKEFNGETVLRLTAALGSIQTAIQTFRLGTGAVVHAVRSLDRDPVVRTIDLPSGTTDVRYDGALLVRLLRYFVGGSASAGP